MFVLACFGIFWIRFCQIHQRLYFSFSWILVLKSFKTSNFWCMLYLTQKKKKKSNTLEPFWKMINNAVAMATSPKKHTLTSTEQLKWNPPRHQTILLLYLTRKGNLKNFHVQTMLFNLQKKTPNASLKSYCVYFIEVDNFLELFIIFVVFKRKQNKKNNKLISWLSFFFRKIIECQLTYLIGIIYYLNPLM